jgi:hypothetical protein
MQVFFLPLGQMTLFLTFALIADDTIRNSLPKEIRPALRSHKALFYQGGLVLNVTSSIPGPPAYIFQIAFLILLCMDKADQISIPMERPRQVSHVVANVTPQWHAPWLQRILATVNEDVSERARPLP